MEIRSETFDTKRFDIDLSESVRDLEVSNTPEIVYTRVVVYRKLGSAMRFSRSLSKQNRSGIEPQ